MAVPQVEDEVFLDAAITNRRVAMMRIDQGRWGNLPGFGDILQTAANDHVDYRLPEVHGDANFISQGEPRLAYEVLAFANEVIRFGVPLHAFHRRLYAWALLFPVPNCESFEVAANNLGRLRRARPEAVLRARSVADELSVRFAQEAGMDEYLDGLIKAAGGSDQELQDDKVAVALPMISCPIRATSFPSAHWRAHDAAVRVSEGLIPTAWCSSVVRAPRHLDLSR